MTYDASGTRTFTVDSVDKAYAELIASAEDGKAVIVKAKVNVVANGMVVDYYVVPFVIQHGKRGSMAGTHIQSTLASGAISKYVTVYHLGWEPANALPTMMSADKEFVS